MPTPAKAYTDPTAPNRGAWSHIQIPTRTDLIPVVAVVAPMGPTVVVDASRIPFTGISAADTRSNQMVAAPGLANFEIKIPTPPLGRQVINTFSSIYKERQVTNALGQIYPPPAT